MLFITQPTYFPWIGFFSFIEASKNIILLDDVQFVRRGWQQRNKILKNNTYQYLSVPVKKSGLYKQLIKDVKIVDNNFYNKHLTIIKHNYSKTPYFKKYFGKFLELDEKISTLDSLCEINIIIIKKICELFDLNINFIKSSDLNVKGKKSEKLINICKKLSFSNLLSNEGTIDYITNDIELFEKKKINVLFYRYDSIKYKQQSSKFVENLSIIDLLFNEGPNSINLLKKGLKKI